MTGPAKTGPGKAGRKLGLARLPTSAPLLAANLLEAAVPFVRNVALARLIAPDAFGLAISLSVVLGMLEVLTDFGLPIFAVRKESLGAHDATMGTLQSLALLRASVLAVLLAAASPWIARAFHAEDAVGVYALLGLIAFLRGFENFGVKETMRHHVFWREALVVACAQVAGAVATVALAAAGAGFACMIWGMLATAVVTVALSHALSPLPYRLRWDRVARQEASQFGRPLLVSGVAVSLNLSDRVLVGNLLGPSPLAVYNVAYGTAQLPRTVLTKFLTSAFLPLFVEQRRRGSDGAALFDAWAGCLSCLAFAYGLGLGLIGDRAIGLVFGAAYQPSRLFMCLVGLGLCVKFLLLLPVPAAYAAGNTRLVALGSILSAVSIAPGAVLLLWRHDLNLFVLGMTASEFAALLVFLRRALRDQAFTPSTVWIAIAVPLLLLAVLAGLTALVPDMGFTAWLAAGLAALGCAAPVYLPMLVRAGSVGSWQRLPA